MAINKVTLRHNKIVSMVNEQDNVSLEDLIHTFNCSESTIRNDLRLLDEEGLLKRTFGGATKISVANMVTRSTIHKTQKSLIADFAFEKYIKEGMTISLDTGSTSLELANKIALAQIPLNVITTSFYAAATLVDCSFINLTLVGGGYNPVTGCFYDENTLSVLKTMHSDYYFMSAKGIHLTAGITISNNDEASLKRTLMEQANKTIVLMDSSKFNVIGYKVVCSLNDIESLITDSSINAEVYSDFKKNDIRVFIAPELESGI